MSSKINFTGNQIIRGIEVVDEIEGKINIQSSELFNFFPEEFYENTSGFLPINFSYIKSKDDFKFRE